MPSWRFAEADPNISAGAEAPLLLAAREDQAWRNVARRGADAVFRLVFVKGQEMVSGGLWWLIVAYDGI